MSSPLIASNASNPLKPLTCFIRSSSLATTVAPQLCSPISTLMAGPITWVMDLSLWLYSTVSLKAQSSSRLKASPIGPRKPKLPSLLQIKPHPNFIRHAFGPFDQASHFRSVTTFVAQSTPPKWTSFSPPPSRERLAGVNFHINTALELIHCNGFSFLDVAPDFTNSQSG